MADMDQGMPTLTEPAKGYALSGKIMLSAIVVLFAVVVFMAGFHLYARWYLIRLRRNQLERRRQRRGGGRTHIVLYADNEQRVPVTDRGLEPAILNTLPVFLHSTKVEPPPECAVCLSEFEENEVVRLLPRCNHSFHIECIDMWFHSHSTCPLCRSPVEPVVVREKTVLTGTDEPVGNVNGSEPGSSSGSDSKDACPQGEGSGHTHTTSFRDRRKGLELVGVRIEVPTRISELDDELTQIPTGFKSPGTRLLSLKRILSMSRKSPAAAGGTTPCGAGSSGGTTDIDLESGPNELAQETSRVQTLRRWNDDV